MTPAVLRAENLRVGYGGKPVLLDVSIEIRPREVLCVIGHNGAGKSTLVRTLFGLAKPEAGRVLVDGQVLRGHAARPGRARSGGYRRVGASSRSPYGYLALGMGLPVWRRGSAPSVSNGRRRYCRRCARFMTSVPACSPAASSRWCRSGGPCWRGHAAAAGRTVDRAGAKAVPGPAAADPQPAAAAGLSILLTEQNVREALKISDRVVVMKALPSSWRPRPANWRTMPG